MNHDASCPACGSRKVAQRNWAKKLFGVLGTAAGATGGFAGTVRGAQIGMTAGAAAGPAGATAGGLAGAVLGGIAGSAIGCELGSSVGKKIDQHMLDNLVCTSCGNSFPEKSA
jgi:hypothetical protein